MKNIWKEIKKPFFVLAPMEDVTDTVFRRVIGRAGRPDLFFTEFTSVEGVQSVGQAKVIHRLRYTESERPLIAQIWGKTPQNYYETTKLIVDMGFDGVDINMGCPEKNVTKQGCCSALIKNHELAAEVIQATQNAAAGKIPVSVKTRIGFDNIVTDEWFSFLLSQNLDAIGVHGRTVREKSLVPCHWNEIGKVVELKNKINPNTIVYGNGDIKTLYEAKQMTQKYGLDGVMIGRGVFHNPWLFNKSIDPEIITKEQKLDVLKYHLELWDETWGQSKNYPKLKKYYKIYLQGFRGAKELRIKMMETNSVEEALSILSREN